MLISHLIDMVSGMFVLLDLSNTSSLVGSGVFVRRRAVLPHLASQLPAGSAALTRHRFAPRPPRPARSVIMALRTIAKAKAAPAVSQEALQADTTTSSSAASSGTNKGTPVAPPRSFKIDAPRKTGNIEIDELSKTRHTCLCTSISAMMSLDALVMPVFNFIEKEKEKISSRVSIGQDEDLFPQEASICGLPDDFKIAFVCSVSDLGSRDIVQMLKVDGNSLNDLIFYCTQVPKRMRLPKEFLVRSLLREFLIRRDDMLGNRLRKYKEIGGIGKDGGPMFAQNTGCYSFELDENKKIRKIIHIGGDEAPVDPKSGLSSDWRMQDNYDDFTCALMMPSLPPVRLASFFCKRTKKGPHSVPSFVGRPGELHSLAASMHADFFAKRSAEKGQLSLGQEVQGAIQAHRQAEAQEHMKRARHSAVQAMAKKKLRRNDSVK